MNRFRERALQILFPLTLVWGSFWLSFEEIEIVYSLIPAPEGHWFHDALEGMVTLLVVSLFVAGPVYCYRRWPWFLRVPESVSMTWLTVRLIVYAPFLFALLAGAIFSAWWILVVSGEDPKDSQYGMSAWYAAYFYSLALTPLFTIVLAWISTPGRDRKGT